MWLPQLLAVVFLASWSTTCRPYHSKSQVHAML